jgi:hypothetical protein
MAEEETKLRLKKEEALDIAKSTARTRQTS